MTQVNTISISVMATVAVFAKASCDYGVRARDRYCIMVMVVCERTCRIDHFLVVTMNHRLIIVNTLKFHVLTR